MSRVDDELLVAEVMAGGTESFGTIVERYEKPIFNLMYRLTGSVENAQDLTQETFLRAFAKLGSFAPDKSFFTWLYTIAVNIAKDHRKKTGRRQTARVDSAEPGEIPETAGTVEDPRRYIELKNVRDALERLGFDHRETLILRFKEDLPIKEIARILGISGSAVKMRIARGLLQLRGLLEKDEA